MAPDRPTEPHAAPDPFPGTPEAEFQAWLAANPVELPDTRRYPLSVPARPSSPQSTRWRLLAVAGAFIAVVIALTWLLTLIGRSRALPWPSAETSCGLGRSAS